MSRDKGITPPIPLISPSAISRRNASVSATISRRKAFVVADTLYRLVRTSFRAWLDEDLSGRMLALKMSGFVLGAAGIAATMKLIGTQDIRTERFLEFYNASKSPWAHRQLHLYEAFNSLPWVIMLVLCYALSRVVPKDLYYNVEITGCKSY